METYTFTVTKERESQRLDKYLTEVCPSLTRNHIQSLIKEGHVAVSGNTNVLPRHKVKEGDYIGLEIPTAQEAEPEPQDIPLDIVFEDDHILVVNKPAGMVVHPAYGNMEDTLVNALLHHCQGHLSGIRGVKMPGIVHRLDKDTSGLMVVAKSDPAHRGLSQQFAHKTLYRIYNAFVYGLPKPPEGHVEGNIGRHPGNRQKMALLKYGGKEAITHYKILEAYGARASLVECRLETGRTHQIRVHMASIGCPLIGDPLYGKTPKWVQMEEHKGLKTFLKENPQQALHACSLSLNHPISGKKMTFESPFRESLIHLHKILKAF